MCGIVINKDRHIEQWNIIKSSELNRNVYGQLIFLQYAKKLNGEISVFSTNDTRTRYPHVKE